MKIDFACVFAIAHSPQISRKLSFSNQPDHPCHHPGRALILLLLLVFIGAGPAFAQDPDLPGAVANIEQIPAGSLVIPMDNVYQSIGAPFNLKSYGLANAG